MPDQAPDNQQTEEKPHKGFNAQFFAMPEQFRHGKQVAMVEPKKPEQPKIVQKPISPKPVVKQLVKPLPKKKGGSKTTKALIVAGAVVIVAILISGYLLIRSIQKQPAAEPSAPVMTEKPSTRPEIKVPEDLVEKPGDVADPFATKVILGVDSDADGLSDIEEQLIYKTNPKLPDTDKDGFLDGNEVFHRYNPGGTAPGTLLGSGLVKNHTEKLFTMYYPSTWTIGEPRDEIDPSFDSSLFFVATTGEEIGIKISKSGMVVDDIVSEWKAQFDETNEVVETTSKIGFELLLTSDKQNALLILNGHVLVFDYQTGIKNTVDYIQTFQMMINSVEKVEEAQI